MTLVEVLVGVVTLALCTAPVLGCVSWMRACAAEATTDALVANALGEQIALARSGGRGAALAVGTTTVTKTLGYGVTLSLTRTVSAVAGNLRLYDVKSVGTWTPRARSKGTRSMTLESYAFAPSN